MGKREQRHQAVRKIIRDNPVKTQRDLAEYLKAEGFACTQATVSRDVLELGLVKTDEGCYVFPEEMRLRRMIAEFDVTAVAAGNLVVIKTSSGAANSVCSAFDAAALPGSLGTVAGDDTIFLAATTPEAAVTLQKFIGSIRQ